MAYATGLMLIQWNEGDVVRKLRAVTGMKLKDLAGLSGVGLQVIHRIEIGKTAEPKGRTRKKLAAAFGLSDRQLLDAIPVETDLPIVTQAPKVTLSEQRSAPSKPRARRRRAS